MWIFFDACCSRKMAREFLDFHKANSPDLKIKHLCDFHKQNTADSVWLKKLKSDSKKWIVITCDTGRSSKEKLPIICKKLGITHVAFKPAIVMAGYTEQKNALMAVWSDLPFLYRLPPGTQVKLGIGYLHGGIKRFQLKKWAVVDWR